MLGNRSLGKAKINKNDEYYTSLSTIEDEIDKYKKHFEGKVVYCNCDSPIESNFSRFFVNNFKRLRLKSLIISCYEEKEESLFTVEGEHRQALWAEYTGKHIENEANFWQSLKINKFVGDGDFRSRESIDLLKKADIVVTNPPFSLFREFVSQLIERDKEFLILGTMNAITYKEFFPLLVDNKVWPGPDFRSTVEFEVPKEYPFNKSPRVGEDGRHYMSVQGITWWTNLDYPKRHEELKLDSLYIGSERFYPTYENFNGINVDKVARIPKDYYGIMGVPISYIGKHNPNQFEIIGLGTGSLGTEIGVSSNISEETHKSLLKENPAYRRGNLCYRDDQSKLKIPYARVLIRRV